MNKILPIIMVIAFWGIYLLGKAYPRVGKVIMAIALAGIVILFLYISKKIILIIIDNRKQ